MSGLFGPRTFFQPLGTATTNNILKSQDLTAAAWNDKTRMVLTANATVAPDGTTTATKLAWDTNNSTHFIGQGSIPVNNLTEVTCSFFAKQPPFEQSEVLFIGYDQTFVKSYQVYFDFARGEAYYSFYNGSGLIIPWGHHVEQWGNGWMRCVATWNWNDAAVTSMQFYLQMVNSPNQGQHTTTTMAGNNSYGMWAWGCQVEQSAYVSPYIPKL